VLLCRDVYHCTPAELERQSAIVVLEDLAVLDGEHRHRTTQARLERMRARRR
jgi:hypothetical protein